MPNSNPHTEQQPLSRSEQDELLLRLAVTERKLSLALQKLDAQDRELSAIQRLAETIGSERQISRLCKKTAEEISRTLGAVSVTILLRDEATGDLVTAASSDEGTIGSQHPRVKSGDGLLWQVMKTGKPLHLPGTAAAKQFAGGPPLSGIAVPVRAKEKMLGVIYACGPMKGQEFSTRDQAVLLGIASQAAVALDNATLFYDLENLFVGIAWSFASALDAKSPWTAGHSKRVTQFSVAIAEELGQDAEFLDSIQTCGLLHDIGKIGISEKLLNKKGVITRQERMAIAQHAEQGAKILEHIDAFQPILPGIRHHHERWDGSGSPHRLMEEDIPLMARMLAVADAYDAMTSDRPYRPKLTRADAIEEIDRCSGSQFDPQIVEAFIEVTSHRMF
jgi:putative nucleotidyltransferase with HDIG domain